MGTRQFSVDQEADIVARFRAGESRKQIGRGYGTRASNITAVLTKHVADLPSHHVAKLTPQQQEQVVRRYEDGEQMQVLTREYGVSVGIIRKYIKRAQGTQRLNARWRVWHPEEIEQLRQWIAAGDSQAQIAQRLQTHQTTVSNLMRMHHISPLYVGRPSGERHGSWKGGRHRADGGYIGVRVDPDSPYASMRSQTGYIPEHRLVMAMALGRPLTHEEQVHHKNGDRTDNRLENLQLMHGPHGKGAAWRCADCGSHNIVPDALEKS